LYGGVNEVKRGYQLRTNIVNNEKGDLFTHSHGFLARWRKHFLQLLNVCGINYVMQAEIHAAEPLVPE
jgi:hypothetical protein